MFSVLATTILGSLFSLIFSLVTTRSFDADSKYSENRKKYLYYYRVFTNLIKPKKESPKPNDTKRPYRKLKNKRQLSRIIEERLSWKASFRPRKAKTDNTELLKRLNENLTTQE